MCSVIILTHSVVGWSAVSACGNPWSDLFTMSSYLAGVVVRRQTHIVLIQAATIVASLQTSCNIIIGRLQKDCFTDTVTSHELS